MDFLLNVNYLIFNTSNEAYNVTEKVILILNIVMLVLVLMIYFHQFFHAIYSLFHKAKVWPDAKKNHKYGYIISARNEEKVIVKLIESIYAQNYDKELMQVFVVADNCTDHTAENAKKAGAVVYERFNDKQVGKSYALDFILQEIMNNHEYDDIEAFIFFDADNLVSHNFTREINKLFDAGVPVSTSFRESKNFKASWVSAGASYAFYRECLLIHHSRSLHNMGTFVSGTGFFVDRKVIEKYGGWKFNTMIEDIEFSLRCALDGIKVEYCAQAKFYDEQPETLKVSLDQRLRWCRGSHESFWKVFGKSIFSRKKKHNQTVIELFIHVSPVPVIACVYFIAQFIVQCVFCGIGWMDTKTFLLYPVLSLVGLLVLLYLLLVFFASCVNIRHKKNMKISTGKRVFYTLMFPVFFFFYIPLDIIAMFKKVKWKPIPHNNDISIDNLQ